MNHEVNIAVQCTATLLTLKLDFIQFLNCTCSCSVYFTPVIIYYILLGKSKNIVLFQGTISCLAGFGKNYVFAASDDNSISVTKVGSWQVRLYLHEFCINAELKMLIHWVPNILAFCIRIRKIMLVHGSNQNLLRKTFCALNNRWKMRDYQIKHGSSSFSIKWEKKNNIIWKFFFPFKKSEQKPK